MDEEDLFDDPRVKFLKFNNMAEDDEIRVKIMHLAFVQRVIFTDHPRTSLFVGLFEEGNFGARSTLMR